MGKQLSKYTLESKKIADPSEMQNNWMNSTMAPYHCFERSSKYVPNTENSGVVYQTLTIQKRKTKLNTREKRIRGKYPNI